MNEKKVVLDKEQAINMLPDGEQIHTFRTGRMGMIFGCDWTREDILEAINRYDVELSGETAQSIGHGMAFYDDCGWVFVETKKARTQND